MRFLNELVLELHRAKLRRNYPTCKIERRVRVDSSSLLSEYNVLFDGARLIDSTIGRHSYLQQGATAQACDIGRFCSIAMNSYLGLPQHNMYTVSTHPSFTSGYTPLVKQFKVSQREHQYQRTVVGHDVWIGHGAMVMEGVIINSGAVVGAGAVVTSDVASYAVVAGVPARVIRYRFDEPVRSRLMESKWWEMSDDWIKTHANLFRNPEDLLAVLNCI